MSDYQLTQLKTMLLVKHLNSLNAVREDQIVFKRIYEWEEEYAKTQEYQGFSAEQQQLFQQLLASDDQKEPVPDETYRLFSRRAFDENFFECFVAVIYYSLTIIPQRPIKFVA
jgi:hypothetical protein